MLAALDSRRGAYVGRFIVGAVALLIALTVTRRRRPPLHR